MSHPRVLCAFWCLLFFVIVGRSIDLLSTWTWIGGFKESHNYGSYGELNEYSEYLDPGVRKGHSSWRVGQEGFAIYGGEGSYILYVLFDDLWFFNITSFQWTRWWGHADLALKSEDNPAEPVYNTSLEYSPYNNPGLRSKCTSIQMDDLDLLGLFGDSYWWFSNDLWIYSIKRSQWMWLYGDLLLNDDRYDRPKHFNSTDINGIGARGGAVGFQFRQFIVLFGGISHSRVVRNDVWLYDLDNDKFAFLEGYTSSTSTFPAGSRGIYDPLAKIGGRFGSVAWKLENPDNCFVVFGGRTKWSSSSEIYNDVWLFNITLGMDEDSNKTTAWIWLGGGRDDNHFGSQDPRWPNGRSDFALSPMSSTPGSNFAFFHAGTVLTPFCDGTMCISNDIWRVNVQFEGSGEFSTSFSQYEREMGPLEGVFGPYREWDTLKRTTIPASMYLAAHYFEKTNSIFTFGGQTTSYDHFSNAVFEYSIDKESSRWMKGQQFSNSQGNYLEKGTWSERSRPSARSSHCLWALKERNELVMFGGYGYDFDLVSGAMNDLWKFQIDTGLWMWVTGSPFKFDNGVRNEENNLAAYPSGRYLMACGLVNDHIAVFGGKKRFLTSPPDSELWFFDPFSNLWSWKSGEESCVSPGTYVTAEQFDQSNSIGSRSNAATWSIPDRLVVFGGKGDNFLFGDLWMWSATHNAWGFFSGSLEMGFNETGFPCARSDSSAWTHDQNTLLLFGGGVFNDLWKYSVQENLWSELIKNGNYSNRPSSQYCGAATSVGGAHILLFGQKPTKLFGVWALTHDVVFDTWDWTLLEDRGHITGNFPEKIGEGGVEFHPGSRFGSAVCSFEDDGKIFISAGVGVDSTLKDFYDELNDLWMYEPSISKCNGISDLHPSVCNGRGRCVSGTCVCNSIPPDSQYFYRGSSCEIPVCHGYFANETNAVCSGFGNCSQDGYCQCNIGYSHGPLKSCEIFSCFGIPQNDIEVCSGHGTCEDADFCECSTLYRGQVCGSFQLWVEILIHSSYSSVILLCLVFNCCVWFFVCCCYLVKSREKIKKSISKIKAVRELEDVELLLEEQKLEADTSKPRVKINQKLFNIDYENEVRLVDLLGEGAFCMVYLIKFQDSVDAVAKMFKLVDTFGSNQGNWDIFEREVEIVASVAHVNLCRFFGASCSPRHTCIITEYCSGGDLDAHLFDVENVENLTMGERMRYLLEISQGMIFLHSRGFYSFSSPSHTLFSGIIHRDLKPANVLLRADKSIALTDFGLSTMIVDITKTSYQMTTRVGTEAYVAPEVVLGKRYGKKYSFAIMSYVTLTSKRNWYGEKALGESVDLKAAYDPDFRPKFHPEEKRQVPKELRRLVMKSWKESPKERPSFKNIVSVLSRLTKNEK